MAVNAVTLFGNVKSHAVHSQNARTFRPAEMSKIYASSNTQYHLEHPRIAGSETLAKNIDLTA